jgi:hypothetical protein
MGAMWQASWHLGADPLWRRHRRSGSHGDGRCEAEKIILGRTIAGSNEVDDDMITHWAFELTPAGSGADWRKIEARLGQITRMLVRRHRNSIERVADELLAKGKLTGRQISRLIERSPVRRLCRDCRMDTTPCAGEHAHRRTTPVHLRCQHKGRWVYYMVYNSVWKEAGMPVRGSAFPRGNRLPVYWLLGRALASKANHR